MSEPATEPGVVEGGRLQKSLKTRRTTKVSIGDVIGAGLFIGGCQFRSSPATRDRKLCSEAIGIFQPGLVEPVGGVAVMSSGSTGWQSVFRRKPVDAFVTETRPDAEGGELEPVDRAVSVDDVRGRGHDRHRHLHRTDRGGTGGGPGGHRVLRARRDHGRAHGGVLRGARLDHPCLRLVLFLHLRHDGGDSGLRRGGVFAPRVRCLLRRRVGRVVAVSQLAVLRCVWLSHAGRHTRGAGRRRRHSTSRPSCS